MEDFKRVIVITGTPGVGKTTISSLLASKLEAKHIDLGKLVEIEDLISNIDELRGTLVVDSDEVSKRIIKIINDSCRDIVIDGHYAVHVVPNENIDFVFVLRRDPDELKKLMIDRGFEGRKLWENLAAEILDVCLWDAVRICGRKKVCEIDTSGKEKKEIVKVIFSILEGKGNCLVGIVDWLGKLDRDKRINDFLNHF